MNEYIILMLDDASDAVAAADEARWGKYIRDLHQTGQFDGGSSIGRGERLRKGQAAEPTSTGLTGFIRVRADSLEEAKKFLVGNPTYEAGGTVEVRELPRE